MLKLTRPQREAMKRVHARLQHTDRHQTEPVPSYRQFRRTAQPGPGCVMVPFVGMWLGIEPDGYTHS